MLTHKNVGLTAALLEATGRLELRANGNGRAHFLNGARVSVGDEIEILLTSGVWLRGRYDWSGIDARWPGLRVALGGPWESAPADVFRPAAVLALHPDAIARWPR